MRNILCYGDSNTWGYKPGTFNNETLYCERFPFNSRWPGVMQKKLGKNYHVYENALNGRTTNIEYPNEINPNGYSGSSLLPISLFTSAPLDLVILFLGVNDSKKLFNRNAKNIADGLDECINIIKSSQFGPDMLSPPEILLLNYPVLRHEKSFDYCYQGGTKKIIKLNEIIPSVVKKHNCHFFDTNKYTN